MTDRTKTVLLALIAGLTFVTFCTIVAVACTINGEQTRDKSVACSEAGMQWVDAKCLAVNAP